MATVVVGLESIGYNLLNDIRIFSQSIGQPATEDVTYSIYKEIISQVVAAYNNNSITQTMEQLSFLPIWKTILYVEDRDEFFELKRDFAARVKLFSLALYELFNRHLNLQPGLNYTILVDSVTVTILVINIFLNADYN